MPNDQQTLEIELKKIDERKKKLLDKIKEIQNKKKLDVATIVFKHYEKDFKDFDSESFKKEVTEILSA